ncbi:MAG TPA: universal stress protein [Caulobacteraceae bacterium]|nr:universal stress protein [Caulobacteraceae bacterium]
MSYVSILTQVQPDGEAAPRLACALTLAKRFHARLIGLASEMAPPLTLTAGYYGREADWAAAMGGAIDKRLQAARDTFDREVGGLPPADTAWVRGFGMPAYEMAAASRAADLIVAGGSERRFDRYSSADAAELAMLSGRPVLVAPDKGAALTAKRVVVAWKDTREARRASADALPFLKEAEAVQVTGICAADEAESAGEGLEQVAEALRRHGVKASAKLVQQPHSDAAALRAAAASFGADLIVMGCYGHSRLGEWAFGGFTRNLLAHAEQHLLLSH